MPLYHTMGIHSLLAMHLVGGCFVPQARWDPEEALRLIEAERITSLYLVPTLFHDLARLRAARRRTTSRASARSATPARAMTSTLVKRCLEAFQPEVFVNHYGSTEVYTFSIGRDQAAQARLRRPALRQHPAEARAGRRDLRAPLGRRGVRAATGTDPTPTRRRSATAGTTPATPGISTPTATSGSTAGSTT